MKLVYKATGKPVAIGDRVELRGQPFVVTYFREPHKPASEGKVTLRVPEAQEPSGTEFYVSIIGAEWIEREDRAAADAVDRGAQDFFAGRHANPYNHATEGDQFRHWITGYHAAKATEDARTRR